MPETSGRIAKGEAPTAVVIGGGLDQLPLFPRLRRLGYRTVLVDYLADPPAGASADLHYCESALDEEVVKKIALEEEASFLVSLGMEAAVPVMARVSADLGLRHHLTVESAELATDKVAMKQHFRRAGVPTPRSLAVSVNSPLPDRISELRFPVVIKPQHGTGARGVMRVNERSDLPASIGASAAASGSSEFVVEELVSGMEISVDCYVAAGEVEVVSVAQLTPMPMLEESFSFAGVVVPAPGLAAKGPLAKIAKRLARMLGITDGVFFFQAITSGEQVWVLEVAGRAAGGGKPRLVQTATGFDLLGAALHWYTGRDRDHVDVEAGTYCMAFAYAHPGTLLRVDGVSKLLADGSVLYVEQYKAPGQTVGGLSVRDRVLALCLRGRDVPAARRNLQRISESLKLVGSDGADLLHREALVAALPDPTSDMAAE